MRNHNIDQGCLPPPPKHRPLQFKRGTASAFKKKNPILAYGEPAFEKDTNKMKVGNGVTQYNDLPYIGDHSKGEDGKSAYDLWIEAGNQGTVDDFLESLIGETGQSAYEAWLSVGNEGTILDFLADLEGDSAYEVWLKAGYEGSVYDYLDWLRTTTWEEIPAPESEDPEEDDSSNNDD